jgi:nucleotide-binding universal stress UspA family protein
LVNLAELTNSSTMTNFIVPVDFSVDSLKGLDWAIVFSRKHKVNIQLVYVLTNSSNFQPSVVEQEHHYAQSHFKKLIQEYGPKLGNDSKIRYIIKKGKVYREVVNQVNSYKNAVVSASTHGASGFEEIFVGSNALKIIAATEQPVFTIRKPVPDTIRRIVLPVKLHKATRQKVNIAGDIAEIFGAELHLVAVSTSRNKRDLERLDSYVSQMHSYFKARDLKVVTKSLVGESLPSLTCNYAEAVNAELIIIMSGEVDKWNVFLGSYAQQMVRLASVPLLNVTPRERYISSGFSTFGG